MKTLGFVLTSALIGSLVTSTAQAAEPVATDASEPQQLAPLAPDQEEPSIYSPAMRNAGIVLTSAGVASAIAGGVLVGVGEAKRAAEVGDEGFPGIGHTFGGVIAFSSAAGLLAAGIPLWVVGSGPADAAEPSDQNEAIAETHVSVGLGRVDVSGTF